MSQTRLRRLLPVCVLVMLTFGIIGTASAYWSKSGSGPGSSATGTTQPVTLSPATPAAQLYPGGQSPVHLVVTNPNPSVIRVGSLALDTSQGTGGFAVDVGHLGCLTSALGFSTQTNGGIGWNVPARVGAVDGTLSVTLADALTMGSAAANACQGATFTVYLIAGL